MMTVMIDLDDKAAADWLYLKKVQGVDAEKALGVGISAAADKLRNGETGEKENKKELNDLSIDILKLQIMNIETMMSKNCSQFVPYPYIPTFPNLGYRSLSPYYNCYGNSTSYEDRGHSGAM